MKISTVAVLYFVIKANFASSVTDINIKSAQISRAQPKGRAGVAAIPPFQVIRFVAAI